MNIFHCIICTIIQALPWIFVGMLCGYFYKRLEIIEQSYKILLVSMLQQSNHYTQMLGHICELLANTPEQKS